MHPMHVGLFSKDGGTASSTLYHPAPGTQQTEEGSGDGEGWDSEGSSYLFLFVCLFCDTGD